eukprot:jgi/Bigna1/77316/fgenesh1_pg.47_\
MSMEFKIEQNADRISEFRADGHVYKLVQEEITPFRVDKVYLAVETRENKLLGMTKVQNSKIVEGVGEGQRHNKATWIGTFVTLFWVGEDWNGCTCNGVLRNKFISVDTMFEERGYWFSSFSVLLSPVSLGPGSIAGEKNNTPVIMCFLAYYALLECGDLKPSNIYIGGGEHQEGKHLKVGGFRNCAFGDEAKGRVKGRVGTDGHMAPEITSSPDGKYNNKVDIFSAGEFWKRNLKLFGILVRRGVMQLIVKGTAGELYSATKDISELKESVNGKSNKALKFAVYRFVAMDLIDGMLETDPERRWNIDRIKSHEFFIKSPDFPAEEIRKALRLVYVEEKRMPFFRAAASGDLDSLQFLTKGILDLDGLDLLHDMEDPKGNAKDMHMLSTELKRALGAEVVAIDSKQQKRSP